jgi:hypothetical protein
MRQWMSLPCIAAAVLLPASAAAQMSAPPIPSVLPGVSKISAGNAAGVLKYCEQKGLVSGEAADAVVDQFPGKPDFKSPDYLAGQAGDILGDSGKKFAIGQSPGYLQSQACNMVLDQAKKLRMAL